MVVYSHMCVGWLGQSSRLVFVVGPGLNPLAALMQNMLLNCLSFIMSFALDMLMGWLCMFGVLSLEGGSVSFVFQLSFI